MIHLHSPECACADCRNRRLICGLDSVSEIHLPDEPRRLSSLARGEDVSRKDVRSLVGRRRRATEIGQI